MVLTDPGFVIAQLVQANDELQVTLKGEGGILTRGMKGGHKDAKP